MKRNIQLENYFQGQIKEVDDIPAIPPTFKKKENKEYQQLMEKFITEQKKIFESWRDSDKQLQNLRIINMDKYNPLGFNIDINYEEIFINNLLINFRQESTYIKLKIASKICIYNYVIFLGEDKNKDLIPILIYDAENYYSLNLDDWDWVQDFYSEGKYILIINPNYVIYDEKMYETEGTDGLLCLSPNETILFNNEEDLNTFFDLINSNNFESLGNIMIMKEFYDKAIYFYEKAIQINKIGLNMVKTYSLLCECYIKYQYYTKGLENIDKCFNLIDILAQENKNNILDETFILTSLFRKIRCLLGLRNFKNAYELLIKIKEDKEFQNRYALDETTINNFMNEEDNVSVINILNIGYNNSLGNFNIKQMLNDEKEKFFLENGDYINPKIEISFEENKGIQIIAKEDINIGEYILVEKAIYFCRLHDPNNNFETVTKLKYPIHLTHNIEYIDCINHLIKILKKAPLDYKDFFVLYNGNNLKQNYESRVKDIQNNISNLNVEYIEKVFKLNSYKTIRYFYNINRLGNGLWKFFSLFNHSCLPNTTNFGIGDFIFLMPNRVIKKGEEITVLYLTTPKHYEARTDLYQKMYNFECNCHLCELEKKNRIKNPNILTQYDQFIGKLVSPEIDYDKKVKATKDFPKFLDINKKNLSGYEIGKAYIELSSCVGNFNEAYQYYSSANNFLNDDFETKKLNLNKIVEFGDSLIEQGDKSISDKFKNLYKKYVKFYKTYYKCDKEEVEMFIKINKEQKIKDLVLEQEENLKHMNFKPNYPINIK